MFSLKNRGDQKDTESLKFEAFQFNQEKQIADFKEPLLFLDSIRNIEYIEESKQEKQKDVKHKVLLANDEPMQLMIMELLFK